MTTIASSPSSPSPATLRELLQRMTQIPDAPRTSLGSLQMGPRASQDSLLRIADAQDSFLKSARSFLRPCLQEAVLRNLTRDGDPLAPPTFDQDIPDHTRELTLRKRKADEATARVRAEMQALEENITRVKAREVRLRDKLSQLATQAEAASEADLNLLDTSIAASVDGQEMSPEDRQNEEMIEEQEQFLAAAKASKAAQGSEATALRATLASEQKEIAALDREQLAAATASKRCMEAATKAELSRNNEIAAGTMDMDAAELQLAVQDEETRLRRNSGIRDWYKETVANLEKIGGVKISVREPPRLSGGKADAADKGLELMVDLSSAQAMEVTLSARDGTLESVGLYETSQPTASERKANDLSGALTQADVEELANVADTFPVPANLKLLVRETLNRTKCATLRNEHLKEMRRRYLVGYRAGPREVTITIPAGIVALFSLHADYPMVAGGAELVTLTGIGGWSANEMEKLCIKVNSLAFATLMDTMDHLEEAVAALGG